jgi:hypothetical protein
MNDSTGILECGEFRAVLPKLQKENNWPEELDSLVEAGSNISTVALQVVGDDEKGSLESETVNYGHESHGSLTQNVCAGEDQEQF